jgi:uridine kinase
VPDRDMSRAVVEMAGDRVLAVAGGHPVRVAIDGITGAGKTTFADELACALRDRSRSVIRVSMDGFHHRRAVRHRQGRRSAAGYYEDAYDLISVRRLLLDPLGPHGDRRYRPAVIDLPTDTAVDGPVHIADREDIVVVDGSFLQKPALRDAWDLVVYLRASFAAAEARGARRDAAAFGGISAALDAFRHRYHAAQRRYLRECDPETTADVVIDVENPSAPRRVR